MLIEAFRGGDAAPIYQRLRAEGRRLPEGLAYRGSWVTEDLARCYQIMECDDRDLLARWMATWEDLVSFEIVPVVTSAQAEAAVTARRSRA